MQRALMPTASPNDQCGSFERIGSVMNRVLQDINEARMQRKIDRSYLAKSMGQILFDNRAEFSDRAAMRALLVMFFDPADVDELMTDAIAEAISLQVEAIWAEVQ